MADNNNFWEDKDDDFWSKPVMSDDWLKEDDHPKPENPYGDPSPFGQNPYDNEEKNRWDDPFAELREPQPEYGIPNQPVYTQNTQKHRQSRRGGREASAPKKNHHVHTIICLIFIGIAVLSVSVSVVAAKVWKGEAVRLNADLAYEEISVAESFSVYDNNRVILEDHAYAVTDRAEDLISLGGAEDEKLIAVYVQVESDEYVQDQYALRHMFIGYDIDGQRQYRKCFQDSVVLMAVSRLGFVREDLLESFGLGNGSNDCGFFFFRVPAEAREITFYAEERTEEKGISIVKRRYEKSMEIWDMTDQDISELISKKRENSR